MVQVNTIQDAVVLYRKVEARIEAAKVAFDAAIAKDKRALEQLEIYMAATLNQAGVAAMNLPGLAEVKMVNKRVFGCADWDGFYRWIHEQNAPDLLHKRIHEGNMQQWIDDHGQTLPPFVNVHTEAQLKILKGK